MDKNTVIGLLLITAIIIGFTIYNRPNQEQMAEQLRLRDSIALVETQHAETIANMELQSDNITENGISVINQGSNISDFFSTAISNNELTTDSISEVSSLINDSIIGSIKEVVKEEKISLLWDKAQVVCGIIVIWLKAEYLQAVVQRNI